jgi:WD40 repeat protein
MIGHLLALVFSVSALTLFESCRTSPQAQTKDVFTVTSSGKVLVFRGGIDKVTVRICPDFAAVKEADGAGKIETMLALHCPKTEKNEKTFPLSSVRREVMNHYAQNYIPDGKPVNDKLKGVIANADRTAAAVKGDAKRIRDEISINIKTINTELTMLNAYYEANPDLVTEAIRSKLAGILASLKLHKEKLAVLSDDQIDSNVEMLKAKAWADGYAEFMDTNIFKPLLEQEKLTRLSEADPLQSQLISALTALSQYSYIKTLDSTKGRVRAAKLSLDGKYLVTASWKDVDLWEVISGRMLKTIGRDDSEVYGVAISPDSKFVVSGGNDNTAVICGMPSCVVGTGILLNHKSAVNSVQFSPDGMFVLTGSGDDAILWNAKSSVFINNLNPRSGIQVKIFSGHKNTVVGVSFSNDGKYIATASEDGTSMVWDVSTGQPLSTFSGHQGKVYSASFSPDGVSVVTGAKDATAKIWNVASGQLIESLSGHGGIVYSAAFSPNGKYVVTGSSDATAKVWEVSTGKQLKSLIGHSKGVHDVSYSSDGKYIVTGSIDGTVKIWDIEAIMANSI